MHTMHHSCSDIFGCDQKAGQAARQIERAHFMAALGARFICL
jgi:hypothetical protein